MVDTSFHALLHDFHAFAHDLFGLAILDLAFRASRQRTHWFRDLGTSLSLTP